MRALCLVASFVVIIFLISNSIQMTSIRQFIQRHQTNLLRASFVVLVLYWVLVLFANWKSSVDILTYASFSMGDLMINYEGGFVRRGLMGQLLLELYNWHPFPLREMVIALVLISVVSFILLIVRLYISERWSLVSLSAIPFLGFAIAYYYIFRRDFIILIAVYGIFYVLSRYWKKATFVRWLCFQSLAVLCILSHEATFFFMIPIMMLVHWYRLKIGNEDILSAARSMLLLFMIPFMAMVACVIFKGDADTVAAIWKSWEPCMNKYPLPGDITDPSNGINALLWDTLNTFESHFKRNFTTAFWPAFPFIPSFPFLLLGYFIVYFLVVKMNTVDLNWHPLSTFDETLMSNVLLLQFIFLLPMFTVLSCDVNRVTTYWIFSSLFAFHFFKDRRLYPKCLTRFSNSILQKLSSCRILKSPWLYMFLVWALPMGHTDGPTIYTPVIVKILLGLVSVFM